MSQIRRAPPAPGPLLSCWSQIRLVLEQTRERIQSDIASYPTPIPACDAQFNHLLETRDRISQELTRLDGAVRKDGSPRACWQFFEGLEASDLIRPEAARELRASLSTGEPARS